MRPEKDLEKFPLLIIVCKRSAVSLFILLLGLMTYLALTPISHEISTLCWDKLNHLAAYLCLGILADAAFITGSRLGTKLILLFLYSVLIETIQQFIPSRHLSGFDIFANALGLILAYALLRAFQKTALYHLLQAR